MNKKPSIQLELTYKGEIKKFSPKEDSFKLGRSNTLAYSFTNCSGISREHLLVKIELGEVWITDLGSTNGTYVGTKRIQPNVPYHYQGEGILLGNHSEGVSVSIKNLEIKSTVQDVDLMRVQELSFENESLEFKKRELSTSNLQLQNSNHELEKMKGDLVNSLGALGTLLGSKQAELNQIELEIQAGPKKLEAIRSEIAAITSESEFYKSEKIKLQNAHVSAKAEFDPLINQVKELEEVKLKIESESRNINQKIKSDSSELQRINDEYEKKKNKQDSLIVEINENQNEKSRVQLELRNSQEEFEAIKNEIADVKAILTRQRLEEAESSLKLAQNAREFEEIKTKRVVESRDLAEIQTTHQALVAEEKKLRLEIKTEIEKRTKLEFDVSGLEKTIFNRLEGADQEAAIIVQRGQEDLLKIVEELSEQQVYLEKLKLETESNIEDSKNQWSKEHAKLKESAIHEYESATAIWTETLRLKKTEEEQELSNFLRKRVKSLAHDLASQSLIGYQANQSIPVSELLTSLEQKLIVSLSKKSIEDGNFNPNLNSETIRFWYKSAAAVAGVCLLIYAGIVGPKYLGGKINDLKIENKAAEAEVMKKIHLDRERMLALNLVAKAEFQNSYVDNVLYNPGYLAIKQDEAIKKEWTVELSQFLFKELLFDDRKLVQFMPVEASLIRGLEEISKILNTNNFVVNLPKMKEIEAKKVEEMWLIIGGRENWMKLRAKEAEFYSKHVHLRSDERIPASDKKKQ